LPSVLMDFGFDSILTKRPSSTNPIAAHLVAHDQHAVGMAFLSPPVSGEKSLPPICRFTVPAKAELLRPSPAASRAPLAMPNFIKLRRSKLDIALPPYFINIFTVSIFNHLVVDLNPIQNDH